MAKRKDVLLNHDYDGIQELDNDMPSWWLWLFYVSIFFAAVYMLHFHVLGTGKSAAEKYEIAMNPDYKAEEHVVSAASGLRYHSPYYSPKAEVTPRIKKLFANYIGPEIGFDALIKEAMMRADAAGLAKLQESFPEQYAELSQHGREITPRETPTPVATASPAEEKNYQRLTDTESLAAGKDIYSKNCATCHGQNGEGGIGPNITDDFWIHGAGMNNIIRIINEGVPAKGMISWRSILNERQAAQVASYMMALYGTNPANAKKAQGEQVDMTPYVN